MSAAESLAIVRRPKELFRPRLDVDAVVAVVDCNDCAVVVVVADGADYFVAVAAAAVVGDAGCDAVVLAVAVDRCRFELKLPVRIRAKVDPASTSV